MRKKVSDAVVDVLMSWGIDHVYGLPGDSVDTTVDALQRRKHVMNFIQVRHEEVAALTAAAEAKLTGKIAVALSIGGPGAIHLLNGLYDAKMDHVPLLAIVGQVPSDKLNEDYFQEVNTGELFADVAVFNRTISASDNLPAVVDQAIRSAYEQQGVAVLTIPDDLPEAPFEGELHITAPAFSLGTKAADEAAIQAAADLIKSSEKRVVLVGKGVRGAENEVREFIENNQLPFVATLPAKGLIGDEHPNYLGNLGKLGTKPAYEAMQEADLLIMIGTNYPYTEYLPENAKTIQIDVKAENIGKRHAVDVAINAEVKDAMTRLNAISPLRVDDKFLRATQKSVEQWEAWMDEKRALDTTPIAPEALFYEVSQTAPDDVIYSIDVGTATAWAARFLPVKPTQDFLISAWLGTMGCGLPGAMASSVVAPLRRAISIAGDGGFAMVMQDFVTAVKYQMPVINIILNNEKLAFIEYEQQAAGQLNYGIDLADMDYAAFAESAGGVGFTAHNLAEFKAALQKAYTIKDRPVLINAYVADDAPLPGKILAPEKKGYLAFGERYLAENKQLPELPPLKDIWRQM
ncbi:MAG TPA: pyruvate oxidase [Lactobacillaceae bacterium]|jgi:pyruvate oxidase